MKIKSILTALALGAVAMSMSACGFKTVNPGDVGVLIRTTSISGKPGVEPNALPSGMHMTGFGEKIVEFPAIQKTYTYTREADERGKENEEVTFSDNNALPMTADVQLVMRVNPASAPALYTKYRLTFDQLFEGPIRNDVRSAIAAETELVPVEYLYKGGRQAVINKALQRVQHKWAKDGVTISQLDWIGNIRYPQVILDSIQAKTKADADTVSATAQVEVAKARAQASIEYARGQAESNRLLAASIQASPQIVELKAIEKWDGHLPTTTGGAVPFVKVN